MLLFLYIAKVVKGGSKYLACQKLKAFKLSMIESLIFVEII